MNVGEIIKEFKSTLPNEVKLVAVSKTKPLHMIQEGYDFGQRIFGENKVQDLAAKYEALPKDIEWHMIGHLQTNKVKYLAGFVSLIHGVDSAKLLKEINKRAAQHNRVQNVLLQLFIASEETKFGLSFEEADELIRLSQSEAYANVNVVGFMGMASNTDNEEKVKQEFQSLNSFYQKHKESNSNFTTLSMGMSGDYKLAIECGSNMIRIGSSLFGARNY